MLPFVSIISLNFIIHLYLVNSAKYTVSPLRSVLETLMEVYYVPYDEVELFENYTKTRNRRASNSAAPVLKNVEHEFEEEYKDIGHSVVMKCVPTGTPTPNITWYKDNMTPVKRTDRGRVLPVTYDVWSIILNDLVTEDSGNYTCRICNPLGCTEHVRRLIITGYPKLFPSIRKGYPGNTRVLISDSVVLSCPTVNLTDYSVKWEKVISGFGRNATQELLTQEDKYTVSDNTLTIRNATEMDEGWYLCTTNNSIGTDQATGYLTVGVLGRPSNEGHSDADMISFVSEVEIMKMIGKHENIINLLGCCTKSGPLYAVVEYVANGCLRDYLKKHKPNTVNDPSGDQMPLKHHELVQFTLQVARGMDYLASRGCIHRDLAARNVLVSGSRVLKVADFGLARDVRDSDYYRKRTAGKLPVRWMAPESLCHNYYNTKSDVWSFGVLTWEIMTYGETPYAKIPMHFLYNYLRQGKRMQRPDNCSENMYQLIQHCCSFNPDDRPSFTELKEKLEVMVASIEHL
ncbi:fibroblast growth factor receptor 3-like [Cydia amplana]|uniref:fibroblast growth factor receptor 3-like n=1 Tax=Cydia amplana TaxID=1869771 RepID=UPI002FE59C33